MTIYPLQANYTRGELSPLLHARVDIDAYAASAHTLTNWLVLRQGGLTKRPAFKMVKEVKDSSKKTRVLPFIFGTEQAYVLEVGDLYIRHYANGGIITTLGGTVTGLTQANPAVVTINAHGLLNGEKVYATGIGGMTELNNREFTVANKTANTFELSGINSTTYGAFTAGGTIKKIVETTTAYLEADLAALDYAQTADVLTVAHLDYKPRELTRTSDTAWSIADVTFEDGPYLDEPSNNINGVTPSASNAIHPKMTSNVLPSGTVANSDADADAWEVFDQDKGTDNNLSGVVGWLEFTPAASAVCNSYWIQCDGESTQRAPASWIFQGWDGAAWVDLDRQSGQSSWGGGEIRFFSFINAVSFSKYRISFSGSAGGAGQITIAEMGWGYNGDYGPTITLTFDAVTGINDNTGFQTDDVGRHIRLRGSDGKWRWFLITGRTSTTVVTGRMYGYALPTLSKIFHWQLGAWKAGQWPSKVSFYESRRVFARSAKEPQTLWLSKTGDFYDYGTSQPLVDDDGMRLRILSGRVNAITWIAEADRLAIGTVGNVRQLGKTNDNAGFGATNFDQKLRVHNGAKAVKPVQIGSVLIYPDYYGKILREFVYDINQDGFIAPDVSILSEHLLRAGVVDMAYQQTPNSIVWLVLADGTMATMTYDREQKIVALTPVEVAPGDDDTAAVVESVCSIPGSTRDEVWIVVKRTIGGVTKRFVETLATEFRGMDVEDGVFLDSALTYSGSATGTVSGLWHLRGLTVDVLADGIVYRGLTVSATGTVTLPNSETASTIHVGLRYTATLQTLALNEVGQKDGVAISRQKLLNDARISVFESLGLKGKGLTSIDTYELFDRNDDDPADGPMLLRTGFYPLQIDMSWKEDGQFIIYSDDPLPATIRGIVFGATGEP